MISAEQITIGEFNDALDRYPALIRSLTKDAKPGSLTLEQLDYFRYVDAPTRFSMKGAKLGLKDVQKLLDWKLRHGTFRPSLPKLVASNTETSVAEITEQGFAMYESDSSDLTMPIKKLSELAGIGPATASLLLAVHDPHRVVFFSDEVYTWLLPEAGKPKYTPKEFHGLSAVSDSLMDRLRVKAVDIEKVAYVLVKEANPVPVEQPAGPPRPRGRPPKPESEKKQKPQYDGPPRSRGRPRKEVPEGGAKREIKPPAKRGRPRKQEVEAPKSQSSPRKEITGTATKAGAKTTVPNAQVATPKRRGRPPKTESEKKIKVASSGTPRPRGRPRKDAGKSDIPTPETSKQGKKRNAAEHEVGDDATPGHKRQNLGRNN